MKNSIKQLLRTPGKTLLFFFLLAAATALLVLGANLWEVSNGKIEAVEDSFTTIGTVEQKAIGSEVVYTWDAAQKRYRTVVEPVYGSVISENVLQFPGASYLYGPEKRPYYGALLEEYLDPKRKLGTGYLLLEFTPVEDGVPDKPVAVKVKNTLHGKKPGETLFVCAHITEEPDPWERGKTYVAFVRATANRHEDIPNCVMEYVLTPFPNSSQWGADGQPVESSLEQFKSPMPYEEVVGEYYASPRGKRWLQLAEAFEKKEKTFPVLPTQSLTLLPSFHAKKVPLEQGREITPEEFSTGAQVCMVSSDFMGSNGLSVGDSITLPLYYGNHQYSPHQEYGDKYYLSGENWLNASGESYPIFWEAEYKIVGSYQRFQIMGKANGAVEIAQNMFIIPARSIKASDENNISGYGPMLSTTTSFQIPNGSGDAFMEAFYQAVPEAEQLEITFHDNGYTKVMGSLNQLRSVAVLLVAVGLAAGLAILILLLYIFIVQQKKRTAVERSLGLTKNQCRISMVSGIVLLATVAITAGTIGSVFLIDRVEQLDLTGQSQQIYSTEYSLWAQGKENQVEATEIAEPSISPRLILIPVGLILLTAVLSLLLVNKNLKMEPILLLSTRE